MTQTITDLQATIATTDNDMTDELNQIIGCYPAVWTALFGSDDGIEFTEEELDEQAIAANDIVLTAIAARNGDEDAQETMRWFWQKHPL